MTDFSSARSPARLCFAYRIAREIVVVNITLLGFAVNAVKQLLVRYGTEGCDCENLSLSSCKHTRAVYPRNYCNLRGERTDVVHTSAVNTLLLVKQPAADNEFLSLVKALVNKSLALGINLVKFSVNSLVNRL